MPNSNHVHPIYKYFTRTGNAQEGLGLPENSTDITPPTCKKGYIAVFHEELNCWIETPDNFIKTKCTNYELVYFSNTQSRIHPPVIFAQHIGEFNDTNFAPISNFFFQLKTFDNFVNPFLMSLTFKNRLNHLNNRIKQLYIKHHALVTKFSQTRYMTMGEGIGFPAPFSLPDVTGGQSFRKASSGCPLPRNPGQRTAPAPLWGSTWGNPCRTGCGQCQNARYSSGPVPGKP